MTTVEEVIEQARDYSPAFTRQAVPDLPAAKALERIQRQLAEAVVAENPDALAIWHVIEAPLPADWEDGVTLPDNLGVLGIEAAFPAYPPSGYLVARWPVTILSANQTLTQPHMYPSAYMMGGLLFLHDLRKYFGTYHGWED